MVPARVVSLALLVCAMTTAQSTVRPPRAPRPLPEIDVEALTKAGPKALPELAAAMWRSKELRAKGQQVLRGWAAKALETKGLELAWGEAEELPALAELHITSGSGHGATLRRLSCFPVGSQVELYEVSFRSSRERYSTKWPPYGGTATVRRAYLKRPEYRTLLAYVAHLRSGKLARPKPKPGQGMSSWGSSRDFLVQVKLQGEKGLHASGQYVGYARQSSAPKYMWLEATRAAVQQLLGQQEPKVIDVDARVRAQFDDIALWVRKELREESSAWWVHERSLQAVGRFGTKASVPVLLDVLRNGAKTRTERPRYYALRSLLELTDIEISEQDLRNMNVQEAAREALRKYGERRR